MGSPVLNNAIMECCQERRDRRGEQLRIQLAPQYGRAFEGNESTLPVKLPPLDPGVYPFRPMIFLQRELAEPADDEVITVSKRIQDDLEKRPDQLRRAVLGKTCAVMDGVRQPGLRQSH